MEYIAEYNGEKNTQIVLDRTRDVIYDGEKINMNTYKCSECEKHYYFEEIKHEHCPMCGIKYEFKADISF